MRYELYLTKYIKSKYYENLIIIKKFDQKELLERYTANILFE